MTHGYHGRVLHIDLSEQRTWVEEPDPAWYRRYGGGGAWGAFFLLRDMDPESCGHTIAWAMECYERGLIDDEVTGGVELRFGNAAAMVRMVDQIGRCEGFGDVLAEGRERAAAQVGRGTCEFVMCVKAKEIPAHEPRNKPGLALIYSVGPIGPDFCGVEHDPDFDSGIGVPYALD